MEALADRLSRDIHERGPLTVAAFMERALYDPTHGYYSAGRRSGVAGDFYTSVDTGPAFGLLLGRQIERMWTALGRPRDLDLVEAGASDGQLMRDVLDALEAESPAAYAAARVTLVERGEGALREHAARLEPHRGRVVSSTPDLPARITGILFANELLDAFPVHRVVATEAGLREVYVSARQGRLVTTLGPLSSDEIAGYFTEVGVEPAAESVADIGLAATAWVRTAARALTAGYLLLIDYGSEARHLFGGAHPGGTLRAYCRHVVDLPSPSNRPDIPPWLQRPGEQDLTAHVDFTAVRRAAEREGLAWLGSVPQSRWLLDLGLGDLLERAAGTSVAQVRERLRLRALVLPGGPGSSHHVLAMARGDGLEPAFPPRR